MRITDDQVGFYEINGYLLLESLISEREIEPVKALIPELLSQTGSHRVLEKDRKTVRSVYGAHRHSSRLLELALDPRLCTPAAQIIDDDIYIHQLKVNSKAAFHGDQWPWHQDYIFWFKEDRIPEPRMTTVAVFLDDVTEFNGPLLFVPGSHRSGIAECQTLDETPGGYGGSPDWISNLTAQIKYSLTESIVGESVARAGIDAPKGRVGSLLFMHPNIFHASAPNLSPFERNVMLVTYNSTHNLPLPMAKRRPEFLCSSDYTAIKVG